MRKSRFTQEQIIGFIRQADAGVNVADLLSFSEDDCTSSRALSARVLPTSE